MLIAVGDFEGRSVERHQQQVFPAHGLAIGLHDSVAKLLDEGAKRREADPIAGFHRRSRGGDVAVFPERARAEHITHANEDILDRQVAIEGHRDGPPNREDGRELALSERLAPGRLKRFVDPLFLEDRREDLEGERVDPPLKFLEARADEMHGPLSFRERGGTLFIGKRPVGPFLFPPRLSDWYWP